MINFNRQEERLPSALIVISIGTLAASLLFMVFVRPPSVAGIVKGRALSKNKVEKEIDDTRAQIAESEKVIRPRLWKGDIESVTSQALADLSRRANQGKVSLAAFRPQRPQVFEGMIEQPYSVYVSGSYPAVRALAASLDAPGTKLVLRSIQVASSDAASDAITMTLGVSAFIEQKAPAPKAQATPKQGGRSGKN